MTICKTIKTKGADEEFVTQISRPSFERKGAGLDARYSLSGPQAVIWKWREWCLGHALASAKTDLCWSARRPGPLPTRSLTGNVGAAALWDHCVFCCPCRGISQAL